MQSAFQQLEEEIQAKQLLLKALKADEKEKKKKLFIEGMVARGYFRTIEFCTRPFKNMNDDATDLLDDPVAYTSLKLKRHADKMLKIAMAVEGTNRKVANRLVASLLELEAHYDKYDIKRDHVQLCEDLRSGIARVRPPKDEERLSKLEKALDEAVTSGA